MPNSAKAPTQPNILVEDVISFAQAAKELPPLRPGRKVSSVTVWKWATKGLKLSDGTRLKLQVLKVGSRWLTSREAVRRLCESLTADWLRKMELQSADAKTPKQ